ncbi:beta-1,3-galactosyltransferase 5-like [Mercenaria mercenaria]|uniref:beta-1,3-galactosyltransferase 5-like n=1 Tax=Mercenaria mercenaria TaxID=6596 RepID=UPI00234E7CEA|nr:beta-1,3-galactosyltransferase 5-like [Mercenaria mercenaria]
MYSNLIFLLLATKTMAVSLVYIEESNEVKYEAEDYNDKEFIETFWQGSLSDLQNPLINHQRYSYVINNENICKKDVFVLALVKSKPERYLERKAIRNTWSSVKSHNGANIVTIFIMGKPQITSMNSNLEKELKRENTEFGDIIQGSFTEHIKNQTYKSIMGLSWAKTFCDNAHFILSTNDDTMVDPFHLIDFLQKQQRIKTDNFLYCSTFFDNGPVRTPGDKSFVTMNEYPFEKYPPHCEDFSFIISNDVLSKLLGATKSVLHFWVDNVYVTGMLAAKAEVNHTDMTEDHGYNLMQSEHLRKDIDNSMFLLAKYRSLRKNWDIAWKIIQDLHNK